jgi:hypothetical protein
MLLAGHFSGMPQFVMGWSPPDFVLGDGRRQMCGALGRWKLVNGGYSPERRSQWLVTIR